MDWLLIILMFSGGPVEPVRAGFMASNHLCHIAGVSMVQTFALANPGAQFAYSCTKREAL
jgi:hypothetical protein